MFTAKNKRFTNAEQEKIITEYAVGMHFSKTSLNICLGFRIGRCIRKISDSFQQIFEPGDDAVIF